MRSKVFLQNLTKDPDRGFTIVELLISMTLFLVISAIALSSLISLNKLYHHDVLRAKANQDLRGIFDLVASEVRLVGENLPSTFPAITLVNGTSGAPDVLSLRRNILGEVLKLCNTITAGTAASNLRFSLHSSTSSPTPASCGYTVNLNNYNAWNSHWVAEGSGNVKAYLFNQTTKVGEFFTFNNIGVSAGYYRLVKQNLGNWVNTYNINNGSIYLLEEWELQLDTTNRVLKLINADDTTNFLNIANNITAFQAEIEMQDGSTVNTFTSADNWREIQAVVITITSTQTGSGKTVSRSWTGKVFPRNIISSS